MLLEIKMDDFEFGIGKSDKTLLNLLLKEAKEHFYKKLVDPSNTSAAGNASLR